MILIRPVQEKDLEGFQALSNIPGLYNLYGDKNALLEKIVHSQKAFRGLVDDPGKRKFVFVAAEEETAQIHGTAMVSSQHGTDKVPHFYFEVKKEKKYCDTISTGFIHGTLRLRTMTDGPSELGGLVVLPDSRNHPDKIGRMVSFARFLFIQMFRDLFQKELLAELLPPLNEAGESPLWEAIGRRFTNMNYWEADELSQESKEFILSLFPREKIYATMLSTEARHAIGKVGKDTEPVYHMLTRVGFEYVEHVDPFDGGPHLWAKVDDVVPIQKSIALVNPVVDADSAPKHHWEHGLIAARCVNPVDFEAISVFFDREKQVIFASEEARQWLTTKAVSAEDGEFIFLPYR